MATTSVASAATLPNPERTPGDTRAAVSQATITSTICTPGYATSVRRVSSTTRNRVFARYHVKHNDRHLYVIDHLIPLELGGSNRLANLWPEPKRPAKRKDRVENDLNAAVCDGRLTLAAAQHAIAQNFDQAELLVTTTSTSTTTTTVFVSPPAPVNPSCPNGTYVNSVGNTVCSPYASPSQPPGATAQCVDGTYSFSQSRSGTCSHHGGVARWL